MSPLDGSIWGSSLPHPGYILRIDPGPNPPDTALTEIYKVTLPGYGIRGMDVDRNGIVWVPLDSGHIGNFDRRNCKGPLNGPGAETGEKCPEGWSFYPLPGPPLQGDTGAAENLCLSEIKSGYIRDAIRRGLDGKEYALPSLRCAIGAHPCPRPSACASHYSSERKISESGADVPRLRQ